MKTIIIGIIGIVVLICVISSALGRSDRKNINHFLSYQGENPAIIDRTLLSGGPYWITKDRRIYKVVSDAHRVYWFRFGGWGSFDVEEKVEGGYKKLQ